jgi:hypothetical protein
MSNQLNIDIFMSDGILKRRATNENDTTLEKTNSSGSHGPAACIHLSNLLLQRTRHP